jgi:hypothetical protein
MRHIIASGICLALFAFIVAGCSQKTTEPNYEVTVNPADFVTVIDSAYLPLSPGTLFVYEGTKDGSRETNRVYVSHETKVILGVTCIVVKDTVLVDGNLEEATLDWYAQDVGGNVWYFGEDSKDYVNGVVVSTAGSWEAGVDGALPGITMLAYPAAGPWYRQEFSKGVAEDKAEVQGLGRSVAVPYGSYNGCLETKEWTTLEPGVVEYKFYATGVGMLKAMMVVGGNDRSELVSVTTE